MEPASVYCPKCGNQEVNADARFCSKCGTALSISTSEPVNHANMTSNIPPAKKSTGNDGCCGCLAVIIVIIIAAILMSSHTEQKQDSNSFGKDNWQYQMQLKDKQENGNTEKSDTFLDEYNKQQEGK
ncbi:MAG: zinc ribbon domain-containing protein [Armatimonadota bacterium]|nr:zinc ribbon domain-containing protein [Armatimonadota bacterium]